MTMVTTYEIPYHDFFQTKVGLLRDGRASSDERSLKSEDADGNLVDLSDSPTTSQHDSFNSKPEPEKVAALEGQ